MRSILNDSYVRSVCLKEMGIRNPKSYRDLMKSNNQNSSVTTVPYENPLMFYNRQFNPINNVSELDSEYTAPTINTSATTNMASNEPRGISLMNLSEESKPSLSPEFRRRRATPREIDAQNLSGFMDSGTVSGRTK